MNRWMLGWFDQFFESFGLGPLSWKKPNNKSSLLNADHSAPSIFITSPKIFFSSMQKKMCWRGHVVTWNQFVKQKIHPISSPKDDNQKRSPPIPYDRSSGIDSNHLDIGTPFFQGVVEVCFVKVTFVFCWWFWWVTQTENFPAVFGGRYWRRTKSRVKQLVVALTILQCFKNISQAQLWVGRRWCLVLLQLQQIGSLGMELL